MRSALQSPYIELRWLHSTDLFTLYVDSLTVIALRSRLTVIPITDRLQVGNWNKILPGCNFTRALFFDFFFLFRIKKSKHFYRPTGIAKSPGQVVPPITIFIATGPGKTLRNHPGGTLANSPPVTTRNTILCFIPPGPRIASLSIRKVSNNNILRKLYP